MSRIDELIAEHGPDGVRYVELGSLLNYSQPTKYLVESTDYSDDFKTPVLTAGQTFILGRTNEETGIYPASQDSPVIIFDDFTTAFKWVDFPFKAKSSAMKMITPVDEDKALFRYIYHAMMTISFIPVEHARHWISTYSNFTIPLPPLPVQLEITRALDAMTSLQAELQAELVARRSQYEFYRDSLLSFNDAGTPPWRWVAMGEIAEVRSGWGFPLSEQGLTTGDVPFYKVSDMNLLGNEVIMTQANHYISVNSVNRLGIKPAPAGTIVFPKIGAAVATNKKRVLSVESAYDNNVMGLIPGPQVMSRYLYHWMQTFNLSELANDSGAMPSIRKSEAEELLVPVPSLEEQLRISSKLDAFDALVNDLSVGLPAEIKARRQQYEYYRDQLLSFKELAA